jgi:O-antigen/teichoic acid export membrane protein
MNPRQPAASALAPEIHSVARGTVVNVVAMVLGAVLGFGLTVVVSRGLQPGNAGGFFELMAIYSILSYTLMLGADTGLTRWISRARAVGGLPQVRRILFIALGPVLLVGILAAAVMWVSAPEIAHTLLRGMAPAAAVADVRIIAPVVPLGALSACIIAALRAYGRMWPYLAIEGLGKPITRMGLVLLALYLGLQLRGVVAAWSLPILLGLLAAGFILTHFIRAESPAVRHRSAASRLAGMPRQLAPGQEAARYRPKAEPGRGSQEEPGRHRGRAGTASAPRRKLAAEFWRFAGPRSFAGTFQIVVVWLDILLVGALLSRYDAGVYGAVSKLAVVGNFALEGTRLAIGPQISALLARKEHARTADLYQSATRWLMMASWPMYVLFMIFPAVALSLFGHRYATAGSTSLIVLSLAMLISLGTGNVTVVLLMGGKSSWNVINALGALVINVGLNIVLMPRIGILGAAIAWAVSIVLDNVAAVIEVWVLLHLRPFGPGYGLVVGTTVACFGVAGLASRVFLGQTLYALITATVAGVTAFAILAYAGRAPLQLTGLASALLPGRAAHVAGGAERKAA